MRTCDGARVFALLSWVAAFGGCGQVSGCPKMLCGPKLGGATAFDFGAVA